MSYRLEIKFKTDGDEEENSKITSLSKGPYFNYVRIDRGREGTNQSVYLRMGREGGAKACAYTISYAHIIFLV